MESTPTATTVLSYLDRPVQFIVMRIGNVSTNSAPRLLLPQEPLEIPEDEIFTMQLEYIDAEQDVVDFELLSVSRLGNLSLSSSGFLTYEPCQHCTGTEVIRFSIREQPIGENHTPLGDSGQIVLEIINRNDIPLIYFYNASSSSDEDTVVRSVVMNMTIDSNRTSPAVLARVAALDFDGYSDNLEMIVRTTGAYGAVGFERLLDAVGVFDSLPVSLTFPNPELSLYRDYLTFLESHVTYLPNEQTFVGTDEITVTVRDSELVQSTELRIFVEVLPSPCQNNGVCGGSEMDPECQDVGRRRQGFTGYNCSCLPGFAGEFCEVDLDIPAPPPARGQYNN